MFHTRFRSMFLAPALLALTYLSTVPVYADDVKEPPATDAQIHELMEVMHSRTNMDNMLEKVRGAMHQGMQQGVKAALGAQPLTADQQREIDAAEKRMTDVLLGEMRWESMEPLMIEVYKRSFSEKELNSMLTFYKSPEGQAVVAKMPLVMQNSMTLMQEHMQKVIPKMLEVQKSTLAQLSDTAKH